MEVTIQGRNLEVDNATRDYISRKLDRIARHISPIRVASVEIHREETRRLDQRFSAEVTVNVDGSMLRSEERAATPMAAIDAAIDILDMRARRYKERTSRGERSKRAGNSIRFEAPPPPELASEPSTATLVKQGRVVKVKRFPIKPMTIDEAIFQLEMLGHTFYLFLNAESQQYNLLYLRDDGDYGLIVPDML